MIGMTEKRFYLMNVEDPLHEYGRWCKPVLEDGETGKQYEGALEVMDLLNVLHDENEQLKAQLYCDSDEGVCSICRHHYLKKVNLFYISKCEKGHEKCSTDALKHCKDFELEESKND